MSDATGGLCNRKGTDALLTQATFGNGNEIDLLGIVTKHPQVPVQFKKLNRLPRHIQGFEWEFCIGIQNLHFFAFGARYKDIRTKCVEVFRLARNGDFFLHYPTIQTLHHRHVGRRRIVIGIVRPIIRDK